MMSFFKELVKGESVFWLCLGFISQLIFFTRFLVQWVVSEIKKKSLIPVSFWYLSIAGSLGLMTYSVYRKDPVFIVGQGLGLAIYIRNLFLVKKGKTKI